jgi:uncharacterized membrane protein
MPTFFNGLPLHPLIVHAAVVLVPLAVLGTIAAVVWPAARRRFGSLVVVTAFLATVFSVLAEQSGEGLEHVLPRSAAIEAHQELGDTLKLLAGGLFVVFGAFMLLHRRAAQAARREGPGTTSAPAMTGGTRIAAGVLAAITIVLALVTAVQVYRIGDSGAQAVWGERVYTEQGPPRG